MMGCKPESNNLKSLPKNSASLTALRPIPHRALWIDAYENAGLLAQPGQMDNLLKRSRRAHINAFILGVKDVSGLVVYPSRTAPHFSEWHRVFKGTPEDRVFPPGFDLLKTLLDAAKPTGFRVYAGVPIFMEGTQLRGRKIGPVWAHPDWQQVAWVKGRLTPLTQFRPFIFASPNHPGVVKHEMAILREVASYPVDGIVLDYCRYYGPNADFSPSSRKAYLPFSSVPVKRWPQDVLPGGSRYREWMLWREWSIKWFVDRAKAMCERVHPGIGWAAYYGGYYTSPAENGVNWASPKFPNQRSPETSVAEFYDYMCLGFYVPRVTPEESPRPGPSVQAMSERAEKIVGADTPILGSLYLKQFAGHPDKLKHALEILQTRNEGTMLFDLSWIRRLKLWDALEATPVSGN